MAQIIFWLAFALTFYTYFGYPLWLAWKVRQLPEQSPNPIPSQQTGSKETNQEEWPTVTIIIPVYNEAHRIRAKLETLRQLDYPKDKISMIFVSDGSTDDTESLFEKEQDAQLIVQSERQGKAMALNAGVAAQSSEVLMFTDARQSIAPDALKKLITSLLQPGIGAVSGELLFREAQSTTAAQIGLYWRYEKWIRSQESKIHSVPGVTGALYVLRAEDYNSLYKGAILDDLEIPMAVIRSGKRVLLESEAYVYDEAQTDSDKEKVRKIRTLTGNFQSFKANPWFFSPTENPIWIHFISHKVMRLVVPFLLMLMFVSSFSASGRFYGLVFLSQCLFYGAGFFGQHTPWKENKLVQFAKVFTQMNWAAVIAFKNACLNGADVKWDKTA